MSNPTRKCFFPTKKNVSKAKIIASIRKFLIVSLQNHLWRTSRYLLHEILLHIRHEQKVTPFNRGHICDRCRWWVGSMSWFQSEQNFVWVNFSKVKSLVWKRLVERRELNSSAPEKKNANALITKNTWGRTFCYRDWANIGTRIWSLLLTLQI